MKILLLLHHFKLFLILYNVCDRYLIDTHLGDPKWRILVKNGVDKSVAIQFLDHFAIPHQMIIHQILNLSVKLFKRFVRGRENCYFPILQIQLGPLVGFQQIEKLRQVYALTQFLKNRGPPKAAFDSQKGHDQEAEQKHRFFTRMTPSV